MYMSECKELKQFGRKVNLDVSGKLWKKRCEVKCGKFF